MDLKNELMYQLEQDHDLQAVSLKHIVPRNSEPVGVGKRTVSYIFCPKGRYIKDIDQTASLSYCRG